MRKEFGARLQESGFGDVDSKSKVSSIWRSMVHSRHDVARA